MGEEGQFRLLSKANQRELFHLQNGLDITTVRELVLHLRNVSSEVFFNHVNGSRNDFADWIREVFHDEHLSQDIREIKDQRGMADRIERRLFELEEEELERYGVHLPSSDLRPLEQYIENQLEAGIDEEAIKRALLGKGWDEKIVDLVIVGKDNPYREYRTIDHIGDLARFHQVLDKLKGHIINAITEGSTVEDIKSFLKGEGWHDDVIDFIFYDVFKPHPNIKKLSAYIIHQVRDENRPVDKVKSNLLRLGWKEYIIDAVIYGIDSPDNSLRNILSYLQSFSDDNQDQVKEFLLQMGWDEIDINEAIKQKELEEIKEKLQRNFNVEEGEFLKEHSEFITSHVIKINKGARDVWRKLTKQFRRIDLDDFQKSNGELHLEDHYTYYFGEEDIQLVSELEGKPFTSGYYLSSETPLLLEREEQYLLLPRVIKRTCIVCGRLFPVTHMKSIEMWDKQRTHKVIKFVCRKHQKQLKSLLEETKIMQV